MSIAANAASPISPSPIWAWRSRALANGARESFKWMALKFPIPHISSNWSTVSRTPCAVRMSYPATNTWHGVQTHRDAFGLAHSLVDREQLLECEPSVDPIPAVVSRRIRQRTPRVRANVSSRRSSDAGDPRFQSRPRVSARMIDQRFQSERFGSLQLVLQRIDGAAPQRFILRGEIDEIGIVRDHRFDARSLSLRGELLDLFRGNRPADPAIRVLHEDLERGAPDALAASKCAMHSSRDRHVCAELMSSSSEDLFERIADVKVRCRRCRTNRFLELTAMAGKALSRARAAFLYTVHEFSCRR